MNAEQHAKAVYEAQRIVMQRADGTTLTPEGAQVQINTAQRFYASFGIDFADILAEAQQVFEALHAKKPNGPTNGAHAAQGVLRAKMEAEQAEAEKTAAAHARAEEYKARAAEQAKAAAEAQKGHQPKPATDAPAGGVDPPSDGGSQPNSANWTGWTPPGSDVPERFAIPDPHAPGVAKIVGDRLFGMGRHAIAINQHDKNPRGVGWQTGRGNPIEFFNVHIVDGDSVGIVAGYSAGHDKNGAPLFSAHLDVDFHDRDAAMAVRPFLPLPLRIGNDPKALAYTRMTAAQGYSHDIKWSRGPVDVISMQVLGFSAHNKGPKQSLAFGWHKKANKPYSWVTDTSGCTIFDLRPEEDPIVDLDALLAQMDAALAKLGWTRKAAGRKAGGMGGAGVAADPADVLGDLTDGERQHLEAWARKLIDEVCVKLSGMTAGSGRGTEVYYLCLKVAPVIGAGVISKDELAELIDTAVHGGFNEVSNDFGNGLNSDVQDNNLALTELRWFRGVQEGLRQAEEAAKARAEQAAKPLVSPMAQHAGNIMNFKPLW